MQSRKPGDDPEDAYREVEDIGQMQKAGICVSYVFFCPFSCFFSRRVPAVLVDQTVALRTYKIFPAGNGKGWKIKVFMTFSAVSEHYYLKTKEGDVRHGNIMDHGSAV